MGEKMIGVRLAEEQLARPELMGVAMAVPTAPVVASGIWLATSTSLSLGDFLATLIPVMIGLAIGNVFGFRMQRKHLPAGLTWDDLREVLHTVWLGKQVRRRELAPGVIQYSRTLLKKRGDIIILGCGTVMVLFAVLPLEAQLATRHLIVFLVFAALTFACYPATLVGRKRMKAALKYAEELLAVPVAVDPLGEK